MSGDTQHEAAGGSQGPCTQGASSLLHCAMDDTELHMNLIRICILSRLHDLKTFFFSTWAC